MDLKQYQKKNNLTENQLAAKIGISKWGLRKIIRDQSPFMTIDVVIKIWDTIGLNPYDYLKDLPAMVKSRRKLIFLKNK